MACKTKMLEELGETELLLPNLVNEALSANDRAKYLMTLLQLAKDHADYPGLASPDLKQERLACGITESDFDIVIERSRKEEAGLYHIPKAREIHHGIVENTRRMVAPLKVCDTISLSVGDLRPSWYEQRLEKLVSEMPFLGQDRITGPSIVWLTSAQQTEHDSLHLLIMDLHKELNRLQQQIATESIDGACVYAVHEGDRPLIRAFMAGLDRTKELKFDHPGLSTTATRTGDKLVIQNDIGLTEAHVLVVHVEGDRVTLTYTDIHIPRLVFFQNLFDRFEVHWEDSRSKRASGLREEMYHLCQGTYEAKDRTDLEAYLSFLGSRLVFLIDWNRARKRLRKFAPRPVCLDVLRWAANHNYGHIGFLTLGGEQLIFEALEASGKLPLPPGGQLADVLGPERTAEFLEFTLRTASEGLRAGRSEFLVRDEISAELRHYIETAHQGLLGFAAEHASLIVELAMAARDVLLMTGSAGDRERLDRTVGRAREWEHRADGLVSRVRMALRRGNDTGPIYELLATADDAADGLEDAVFRLSLLLSSPTPAGGFAPLQDLAGLLVQGAQEYLKAVENARQLHRGSPREQVSDFLEAVDRTITIEHQTDDVHRCSQVAILSFSGDFKQWHLFTEVADKLEGAADALMRSALVLRDDILGDVLRR